MLRKACIHAFDVEKLKIAVIENPRGEGIIDDALGRVYRRVAGNMSGGLKWSPVIVVLGSTSQVTP